MVLILVFIWLSGSSVFMGAFCSWFHLLICFSVSFSVLVLGLHRYVHNFYCIFPVISNLKKGICGSSRTNIGYTGSDSCCFCWVQLGRCEACHGSGSLLLGCHVGGLGSILGQSVWDLCWAKQHWHRFFSEYFGFSLSALHTHSFACHQHFIIIAVNIVVKYHSKKE